MKKKSQEEMVLAHLKKYGTITSWQAIMDYGITRLSAKIFTLRDRGYDIKSDKNITRKNRFGRTITYVKYELPKESVK